MDVSLIWQMFLHASVNLKLTGLIDNPGTFNAQGDCAYIESCCFAKGNLGKFPSVNMFRSGKKHS